MKSQMLKESYQELNVYYLQLGLLIAQIPFWIYEKVDIAWGSATLLSIMTIIKICFRHAGIKDIERIID